MFTFAFIGFFVINSTLGKQLLWEYTGQYLVHGENAQHNNGDGDNTNDALLPLLFRGRGSSAMVSGYTSIPYSRLLMHYSEYVHGHTRWSQQAELRPYPPTSPSSRFGDHTVGFDEDGKIVFAGCSGDDAVGSMSGSVFVFSGHWTKWTQVQKLFPGDPAPNKLFGSAVDNKDSYALVGAYGETRNSMIYAGSAYAFTRVGNLWTQTQKILPPMGTTNECFGSRIRISGSTAVVSAPATLQNPPYGGRGSVYIYAYNNQINLWSLQQNIAINDNGPIGQTGLYTDIYGYYLVIGTSGLGPYDADGFPNGGAYVYKSTASNPHFFTLQQVLTQDGTSLMGPSVARYGNYIFVGSLFVNNGEPAGDYTGGTYVFTLEGSTWTYLQLLRDPYPNQQQFCNPYVYGSKAYVTDSSPIAAAYALGGDGVDASMKCLIISVADQFGDGWDIATLSAQAPYGKPEVYAPYCDSNDPFAFTYCPLLPTDCGIYSFSILNATKALFPWEIHWTVQVQGSSVVYMGDQYTTMKFYFNCSSQSFVFVSGQNLLNNRTCAFCAPKPTPKPKPHMLPDTHHPAGTDDKSVRVSGIVSTPILAAPKVVQRRLQDSPTYSPTVTAAPTISFSPTTTASPTTPTLFPTTPPVPWPTLNTSDFLDWHWLHMQDMDDDGWFERDGTGTAYYVSDSSATTLLLTGTLCPGLFSFQCWQNLEPGTYILRIGGALDVDSGEHTWSFCGKTGGAMQQVLFRIYEVYSPTAVPTAVPTLIKPEPGREHVPLKVPPAPPAHPRPPELKCEVLLAYSKKKYCADPSISKINLKGHLLLRGMDNETAVGTQDRVVLGQAIASVLSVKMLMVQVDGVFQSYDMSGRIISFTISVDGLAGYNFKYYNQLEALLSLLTDEMSSPSFDGRLVSAIQALSAMSTTDTNILKSVDYAMFMDLYLSNIGSKLKLDLTPDVADQSAGLTSITSHMSSSSTADSVSKPYSYWYLGAMASSLLLALLVLGLLATLFITRGDGPSVMSYVSSHLVSSTMFPSVLDSSSNHSLISHNPSSVKYNNIESADEEEVTATNELGGGGKANTLPKHVSKVQKLLPVGKDLKNFENSFATGTNSSVRNANPRSPQSASHFTTLNEIKILSDFIAASKNAENHTPELLTSIDVGASAVLAESNVEASFLDSASIDVGASAPPVEITLNCVADTPAAIDVPKISVANISEEQLASSIPPASIETHEDLESSESKSKIAYETEVKRIVRDVST